MVSAYHQVMVDERFIRQAPTAPKMDAGAPGKTIKLAEIWKKGVVVIMPYDNLDQLPENVRGVLPRKAQEIYLAAYNNALEQYRDPSSRRGDDSLEETAAKVAWAAVKQEYRKNTETGNWERK